MDGEVIYIKDVLPSVNATRHRARRLHIKASYHKGKRCFTLEEVDRIRAFRQVYVQKKEMIRVMEFILLHPQFTVHEVASIFKTHVYVVQELKNEYELSGCVIVRSKLNWSKTNNEQPAEVLVGQEQAI